MTNDIVGHISAHGHAQVLERVVPWVAVLSRGHASSSAPVSNAGCTPPKNTMVAKDASFCDPFEIGLLEFMQNLRQ